MQLLREDQGPDHTTLAALFVPLGESWETFAKNKLRVLGWPEEVLDGLRKGLPFSLGAVVAGAPAEHQARLLELARGGMTRADLQAEVARLRAAAQPQPAPVERVLQVIRPLGNRRALIRLNDSQLRRLEQWLAKMPVDVREALTGEA